MKVNVLTILEKDLSSKVGNQEVFKIPIRNFVSQSM